MKNNLISIIVLIFVSLFKIGTYYDIYSKIIKFYLMILKHKKIDMTFCQIYKLSEIKNLKDETNLTKTF